MTKIRQQSQKAIFSESSQHVDQLEILIHPD